MIASSRIRVALLALTLFAGVTGGTVPEPLPTIECPEGMVPGAPDDEGNFACQNNDPQETPPASEPVVAEPTFTG